MSTIKRILTSLIFIFLCNSCRDINSLKEIPNSELIIGNWVIDSIKTPTRTLILGSNYCILGKPDKRRYLVFHADNSAKHIKTDLGEIKTFKYSITTDSVLTYSYEISMANVKTISFIDDKKLILYDTSKIDGCLFRRPAFPGDKSWTFERVYYFYHKE